jgi:hypothetical protein
VQELPDQLLRGFIGEIAVGVEFFVRLCDHDLGLVERVHVEKNEGLAEMVLSAGSAEILA